ncbi:MAG: hypothetical protein KC618_01265, partial [Candidatus Omnitrophica bacterium]|nr:hypothetical protein [Candidatus Omnitrophota bacterium]
MKKLYSFIIFLVVMFFQGTFPVQLWADTVSGTVYTDEGITNIGTGKTVQIAINGTASGSNDTDGSGNYSVGALTIADGDVLTAYLDDETENGVTVTVGDGNDLSGLDLYEDHLIIRQDDLGALTNANLSTAAVAAETDISAIYSVSGSDLTTVNGITLYVATSHAYTPGGDVDVGTSGTSSIIDVNGTMILTGTQALYVYGDMDSSGTFSAVGTTGDVNVDGELTISGGVFTSPSGLLQVHDFTYSSGTITFDTTSLVEFDGFGGTLAIDTTTGIVFQNVNISARGSGSVSIMGIMDIDGTMYITEHAGINGDTIEVSGNVESLDSSSGSAEMIFDGTADQLVNARGGVGGLPGITINKPSGTLTFRDTINSSSDFEYVTGTVVFESTNTMTFGKFNSTQTIESTGITFASVELDANGFFYFDMQGGIDIDGNLTITAVQEIRNGLMRVGGDVTVTDSDVNGSGVLVFDGTGTQTFDLTGNEDAMDISIYVEKTSGAVELSSALTLDQASKTFEIQQGTFDLSGYDLTVSGSGGTFIVSSGGVLQFLGTESLSIPTLSTGSTVALDGTSGPYDVPDWSYSSLTINGSGATFNTTASNTISGNVVISAGTLSLGAALDIDGALTISGGTLDLATNNQDLNVAGNITISSGGVLEGTGTVTFDGDLTYTDSVGGTSFGTVVIGASPDTTTLASDFTADSLAITTGDFFVTDGYDVTIKTDVDIDGTLNAGDGSGGYTTISVGDDWDATGGTFVTTNSTVMFTMTSDNDASITSNGEAFNNLTINDGLVGYWKLDEAAADTCDDGTSDACDSSGYENHGTWEGHTTTSTTIPPLNFSNVRSGTFDGSNDYININNFSRHIVNSNFTLSVWAYVNTGASGHDGFIGMRNGSDADAYILRLTGTSNLECRMKTSSEQDTLTATNVVNFDTWQHYAFTYDGSFIRCYVDGTEVGTALAHTEDLSVATQALHLGNDGDSGLTRELDGYVDDARVYNRALSDAEIAILANGNNPSLAVGEVTLQDDLDVDGDLVLFTGTMDTGANRAIALQGDWDNRGGVFVENSGTVTLDGTDQTIEAGETFYNLTKTVASAATLTFGTTSTTTITNTLTLNGASGQLLSLRSSIDGQQWKIEPQGTRDLDYLDVKDSNNIDATLAQPTNSTDSGNNTNWFGVTFGGRVYSDEGSSALTGVTVRIAVNGTDDSTDDTDGSGDFSITLTGVSSGDIITAYLEDETQDAVTVTESDGTSSLTNFDLYQDYLIVRHDNGGSLTNADLTTAVVSGEDDISNIYSMSSGVLTMTTIGTGIDGNELLVWTGDTYAPGAVVYANDVDINGTFTMT